MNFFDHKDLGNHLLQLCPKVVKHPVYRTVILHVVLCGCETWSGTLREERRLRVCENRVLRGIFGPKRDEVIGEWRRLHNVELQDLCSSNIFRVTKSKRWAGTCSAYGEEERCMQDFGEGTFGRPRRRWEDNIKMDFQEVGWGY